MILFIAAITIAIVSIGVFIVFKEKIMGGSLLVCAAVLFGLSCIAIVPSGEVGVITTFGNVEDTVLDSGLNFKKPWQTIVKMNTREQKLMFEAEAFSADIQQVKVYGSANYSVDKATAMTLYKDVGVDYMNKLISPRLLENVKTVFSKYEAEGLIENRSVLSSEIKTMMAADMESYGISVVSVSVENVDFTDAFTDAVEAKQVATQKKLKAQTEQEQATMETKAAAERKKIDAETAAEIQKINADAEAYRVKVESDAEAEANKKLSQSIEQMLIEYRYADRWNGELPDTYVCGDSALPVLQIGEEVVSE